MRPTPPSIPHTISRYAYAELRAFCRQYGEKKFQSCRTGRRVLPDTDGYAARF